MHINVKHPKIAHFLTIAHSDHLSCGRVSGYDETLGTNPSALPPSPWSPSACVWRRGVCVCVWVCVWVWVRARWEEKGERGAGEVLHRSKMGKNEYCSRQTSVDCLKVYSGTTIVLTKLYFSQTLFVHINITYYVNITSCRCGLLLWLYYRAWTWVDSHEWFCIGGSRFCKVLRVSHRNGMLWLCKSCWWPPSQGLHGLWFNQVCPQIWPVSGRRVCTQCCHLPAWPYRRQDLWFWLWPRGEFLVITASLSWKLLSETCLSWCFFWMLSTLVRAVWMNLVQCWS